MKHYEEYKILTLGDGNWDYNLKFYLDNLSVDYKKDLQKLKQRYDEAKSHEKLADAQRERLIKELYLDDETIRIADFLAKVGHTRLVMRIEGWIPFVGTIIKIDIALSKALNLSPDAQLLLNFMTPAEFEHLAKTGEMVTETELIKRRGKNSEFLILHDNGVYRIFFGDSAGKKFRQLVPPIDHTVTTELHGSTAVRGNITGTVCVYQWGDNIAKKLAVIHKHPILVAGQTRPSMMPIIRLAKGIITDEGGITSHAAIVSRELGIPSVIGTIHATRVFKDGDRVELDADHGVVRKLS
jgi:phosphohistidine swiveling domain-containing protein